MKVLILFLVVLFACSPSSPADEAADEWEGPPARLVSDLGPFEARSTYNEHSSVSDGGRWVVFNSHVRERPSRLVLVDTKRGRVRQIDDSYDGSPRTSAGVGRFNIAFALPGADITPDGRFVVFVSAFSNLVRQDANRAVDVFVFDRMTGRTRLVSTTSEGEQANGDSYHPAVSADGGFVAFDTRATNLSSEDTDRESDVYLKNLRTGDVELISVGASGKGDGSSGYPDVSRDGERISFTSDAPNLVDVDSNGNSDVFVRDRPSLTTMRASVTSKGEEYESFESCESATCYEAGVSEARISDNGRIVVFKSEANLLVPEDENYNSDIFAHEVDSGVTERVSVRSDGEDAYGAEEVECGMDPRCAGTSDTGTHSPSISADGELIYFISSASEVSDEDEDDEGRGTGEQVFVRDRANGVTSLVSRYRDGSVLVSSNWYRGEISSDGRWITFSNDSMKLDGPRGDQDPGPDVFLQRLPGALK